MNICSGSAAVNGLDIKFVDSHEQSQTLQLMVIEIGSNRKQSIQWLNAMHRVRIKKLGMIVQLVSVFGS